MDHSLPASSVNGILQPRILEWAAMLSSRACFTSPALAGRFFATSTTWEALVLSRVSWNLSDQSLLSLAPNREMFVLI